MPSFFICLENSVENSIRFVRMDPSFMFLIPAGGRIYA